MLNDYVLISDGRIINLSFDIDIFIDKAYNQAEIINNVIQSVKTYFDVNKWDMGETIFLGQLNENINNVGGVLNVTNIKVTNEVGGNYSLNEISQPYVDQSTREIDLTEDFSLFSEQKTMFEIKFPTQDIRVRVKSASVQ
jgi:hypothetical protein